MTRKGPARIPEYLQHILDAIDRATEYVDGMDVKAFESMLARKGVACAT